MEAGYSSFQLQLDAAITQALAELAENFETRNRKWHKAHEELCTSVEDICEMVPERNFAQMARPGGGCTEDTARGRFDLIKLNALGDIRLHQSGWSSPKPRPWHERHPLLLAAILGLLSFLTGLYAEDIRGLIDTQLQIERTSQSSNPGTPPAGG